MDICNGPRTNGGLRQFPYTVLCCSGCAATLSSKRYSGRPLSLPTDDFVLEVESDAFDSQPSWTERAVEDGAFHKGTFTFCPVGCTQGHLVELCSFHKNGSGQRRPSFLVDHLSTWDSAGAVLEQGEFLRASVQIDPKRSRAD